MEINSPVTAQIFSSKYWNKTGIILEAGCTYILEVSADDKWHDLTISCNADGYTGGSYMQMFEGKKRFKGENWFKLIGTIEGEKPFVIGTKPPPYRPEVTGELFCYANDYDNAFFYLNNWGSVTLKITRTN